MMTASLGHVVKPDRMGINLRFEIVNGVANDRPDSQIHDKIELTAREQWLNKSAVSKVVRTNWKEPGHSTAAAPPY